MSSLAGTTAGETRRLALSLGKRRKSANGEITSLEISSNSRAILICSRESKDWVEVWDLVTQTSHCKINGLAAVLAPQGTTMAVLKEGHSSTNKFPDRYAPGHSIQVLDWASSKARVKPLFEPAACCREPLAFSRDGSLVAVGDRQPDRLIVYQVATGARLATVLQHHDEIQQAVFAPDGSSLLTAARDSTLRITDARSGLTRGKLDVGTCHRPRVLAIAPGGDLVASVWGTAMHLWRPGSGSLTSYGLDAVRTSEGFPLAIAPDCRLLACRTDRGIDVSDLLTGRVLASVESTGAATATAAAFSPDGTVLAVGRFDGLLELWEMRWDGEAA